MLLSWHLEYTSRGDASMCLFRFRYDIEYRDIDIDIDI